MFSRVDKFSFFFLSSSPYSYFLRHIPFLVHILLFFYYSIIFLASSLTHGSSISHLRHLLLAHHLEFHVTPTL